MLLLLLSLPSGHFASAASPSEQHWVPLLIRLPPPDSGSAVVDLQIDPEHVEALRDRPRPPLMVPAGTTNLALGCRVGASNPLISPRVLQRLVDGSIQSKNCRTDFVVLPPGVQWVQVDLGAEYPLYAVCLWHSFPIGARIFHGVVVQIADDAEFAKNVRTLFNNDYKNLVGLGKGKDREYFETHEGKLIEAKGQVARFVWFYSAGSTYCPENHYFCVDVYGLPH